MIVGRNSEGNLASVVVKYRLLENRDQVEGVEDCISGLVWACGGYLPTSVARDRTQLKL